jgi:hypothetical protein
MTDDTRPPPFSPLLDAVLLLALGGIAGLAVCALFGGGLLTGSLLGAAGGAAIGAVT